MPGDIIQSVSSKIFHNGDFSAEDARRITQIAAKLGAEADDEFLFITLDDDRVPAKNAVLVDQPVSSPTDSD